MCKDVINKTKIVNVSSLSQDFILRVLNNTNPTITMLVPLHQYQH